MTKDKEKNARKTWSIRLCKHPKYPEFTIRIAENVDGGVLQVYRTVNGKLTAKSFKCKRSDLGPNSNPKAQELEGRRRAAL